MDLTRLHLPVLSWAVFFFVLGVLVPVGGVLLGMRLWLEKVSRKKTLNISGGQGRSTMNRMQKTASREVNRKTVCGSNAFFSTRRLARRSARPELEALEDADAACGV